MLNPTQAVKNYFEQNETARHYALDLISRGNTAVLPDYYASQIGVRDLSRFAREFLRASINEVNWSDVATWLTTTSERPPVPKGRRLVTTRKS